MREVILNLFMYNNMDCMGWRWKKRFHVLLGLLIASPSGYGLWKIWSVILPQMNQVTGGMTDTAGNIVVGGILGLSIGVMGVMAACVFAVGMTLFLMGMGDGFKTKKW